MQRGCGHAVIEDFDHTAELLTFNGIARSELII
jgi:hypothetical protein